MISSPQYIARSLGPSISAANNEMETLRYLPQELAMQMAEAGIFRIAVPKELGGDEVTARTLCETLSILSEYSASAGWVAMIAATTGATAALLEDSVAREVFADPLSIVSGVFAPMGRAVSDGEAYTVSGKWSWGSGSHNAKWILGGSMIMEEGRPRMLDTGGLDSRMMIFRAEDVDLLDTWHSLGLKGTGSGDYEVTDVRVPLAHSVSLISDPQLRGGALYKFPVFGLLALGIASVAMGNAKAALDSIADLATHKKSQGIGKSLAERPIFQNDYAQLLAKWRAARAYLFEEIDNAWALAETDGDIPLDARANLRMACTHMTASSAEICQAAYQLGGGAALFLTHPLQRHFRDSQTMTAHIMTATPTWQTWGRIAMGIPTNGAMV